MLRLLSITNLATIEKLELEFSPGFNVLTGETGTGKSIIVDSLALLAGARADRSMVRTGAKATIVEGVFELDGAAIDRIQLSVGDDEGPDLSDGTLILAREVNAEGRGTCRVNGRIVPLRSLAAIGEKMIDIHGQGEQQSLLRVHEHLGILDRYGRIDTAPMEQLVQRLRETGRTLQTIQEADRDLTTRTELRRFEVAEIDGAELCVGEEQALLKERSLLANAERLKASASTAHELLHGSERDGVMDLLGKAVDEIRHIAALDEAGEGLSVSIEGAMGQIEDIALTLRDYRESFEYDPARLDAVEERMGMLARLKRKYGQTEEAVLAYREAAASELAQVIEASGRTQELSELEGKLKTEIGLLAGQLSQTRKEAGEQVARAIEQELGELVMERIQIITSIVQAGDEDGVQVLLDSEAPRAYAFTETGIDQVQFLISPNPGEPPKPLVRIASGGEIARVMLAIKVVLATADQTPVLVFDEVDSGVGGRVAAVVGQKLAGLSKHHQVMCVTHLPQIASYADQHIGVTKGIEGARTVTSCKVLDEEERVAELTAMLGSNSRATGQSAAELLQAANRWKAGWRELSGAP